MRNSRVGPIVSDPGILDHIRGQLKKIANEKGDSNLLKTFTRRSRLGSGVVKYSEYKYVLRRDFNLPSSELSDHDIKVSFDYLDVDASGVVNIARLLAFINGAGPRKPCIPGTPGRRSRPNSAPAGRAVRVESGHRGDSLVSTNPLEPPAATADQAYDLAAQDVIRQERGGRELLRAKQNSEWARLVAFEADAYAKQKHEDERQRKERAASVREAFNAQLVESSHQRKLESARDAIEKAKIEREQQLEIAKVSVKEQAAKEARTQATREIVAQRQEQLEQKKLAKQKDKVSKVEEMEKDLQLIHARYAAEDARQQQKEIDKKRAINEQAISLQDQIRDRKRVYEERRQEDVVTARELADVAAQNKADELARVTAKRTRQKLYEQALRAQILEKERSRRMELAGPMSARERDLNASLLRRANP